MPSPTSNFKDQVYRLTRQIPKGRVSTYGAIAKALGRPNASRAVGRILRVNPTPLRVPCHRVVHFDGRVGGYGGATGQPKKVVLLTAEGITIRRDRVQNLQASLFTAFR